MSRPEPIARHERVVRDFFTALTLHGQQAAGAIGMHLTDVFALGIVEMNGPLPAGELAEHMGLSTGATTRLIDRLERGGQVRRAADPADRRRVIVELTDSHEVNDSIDGVFEPLGRAMDGLLGSYPDDRLEEILDFLGRATHAIQDATVQVREIAATRVTDAAGRGPVRPAGRTE